MSLFDKLSGFAQKAKENIASKTLISKDKRLERSLSEYLKASDIYFEKISTYGLPSKVDVVAFDCIAGLLAVGHSKFDNVKVFGKGISATIRLPKAAGIKYLQFQTGYPVLIIIDKKNTIFTVDLRTKSIQHTLQAQDIITCHEYCTGTDWLFIGYANGYVDIFDIMQGILSPYQIPNLLETLVDQQGSKAATADYENCSSQRSTVVVDLQMHPTDLNTIVVGYETAIFIWNIREATIRRSFDLVNADVTVDCRLDATVTCFAWSPDGTQIVTGHDDGYIHLWDSKHGNKPIASRRVAEYFAPPDHSDDANQNPTGPIYQIAWYTNEKLQKSYMLIAADLETHHIQGLNILEYDLSNGDSNNNRVVKKQTLLPLPADLSHFLILSTNPYYLGMYDPLGVAVIDIDHCLQIYSLEHGYPQLKQPPALEFISPVVLNACYIPHISEHVFQKLAAYTIHDRKTRYFPITGGVAGPEHVYRINSNDILLTIHQGEILKFWDASYTGLRPLSHLTIRCLKEPVAKNAFASCVDFNRKTGTVCVGLSDGSILLYQYHPNPESPPSADPQFASNRNEEFINSCNDTLKEISDLLADMQTTDNDVDGQMLSEEKAPQNLEGSTNPFLDSEAQPIDESTPPDVKLQKQPDTQSPNSSQLKYFGTSSVSFKKIHYNHPTSGYHASLLISLGSPVRSIIGTGVSIIAVALDNGQLYVIDTEKELVLNSFDVVRYDIKHKTTPVTVETAKEQQDGDVEVEKKSLSEPCTSISSVHFFNTYSPFKLMSLSTQLFVSLSNGRVYQFNLTDIDKEIDLGEHLVIQNSPGTTVVDMHVVDLLEGKAQVAVDPIYPHNDQSSPSSLTKVSTAGSSNCYDEQLLNDIGKDGVSSISKSTATGTSNTSQRQSRSVDSHSASDASSSFSTASKRKLAIGKGDYRQQENPHLLVCTFTTGVSVYLTGYNIKLFGRQLNVEASVIRSEIITVPDGTCLCLLLSNGRLAFFSLPTLEPILDMSLPNSCLVERLNEAFLSQDGRVVFWSGDYELEQFSIIAKPEFPVGESVMLFDQQKLITPHPSVNSQRQKPKKSWIGAVAGAFQKEPLTVEELDSIMGRMPVEDPNEVRKQKVEEYKAKMKQQEAVTDSGNGSNVFAQLGQKMNERGEKLNELDKKFQDMNAASGDFLKAIREYTERQERKKWWEF